MEKITPRQKEIFLFITRSLSRNGSTPTVREIARHCGLSIGPVQKHLRVLIARGYLRHKPGLARGLEPCSYTPTASVPLVGRVHAGLPADPVEDAAGYVPVDRSLVGDDCFALAVKGDSMTGSGIHERDIVVVRRQPSAEDGETVVALVDGEAAVKKFRRRDGEIWLESTNPAYPPLRGSEINVVGKVVYLMRRL